MHRRGLAPGHFDPRVRRLPSAYRNVKARRAGGGVLSSNPALAFAAHPAAPDSSHFVLRTAAQFPQNSPANNTVTPLMRSCKLMPPDNGSLFVAEYF